MAHTINAEMVASVHSVEVSPGDSVDAGGLLVVLESMKMEIPVSTPIAGIITELHVEEEDLVEEDQDIATLEVLRESE